MFHTSDETGECPVDPSADNNHRQDVGHVAFEHVGHGVRIGHRVGGRRRPFLCLEVAAVLTVEEVTAHEEGGLGHVLAVLPQQPRPQQRLAVSKFTNPNDKIP